MRFKFFWNYTRISAALGLRGVFLGLSILHAGLVCGQHLDWAGDVTIFGTPLNEHDPELVSSPDGALLRAFCIRSDSMLCMKTSTDNGASWSASGNLPAATGSPILDVAADRDFQYVLVGEQPAARRLYRFEHVNDDWDLAVQTMIAPLHTLPVAAMCIACDADFQPSEPYVNICWTERFNLGLGEAIFFTQSRDRGHTFLTEQQVHIQSVSIASTCALAMTAAWQGDHERVLVIAAVDRGGSVPEEIRIFSSEDQGNSWSNGIVIDSSAAEQRHPTTAAFETIVIVAYERRAIAGAQRDIVYSYSPDGGMSFSPLLAAADSRQDESAPKLVINDAHDEFYLMYVVKDSTHDSAQVVLRSGLLTAPWTLSAPLTVGTDADAQGGLAVARSAQGIAAAWASHFVTGDLDVRFDASWRSTDVTRRISLIPVQTELGSVYPNPFNSVTTLPIILSRGQNVHLFVTDILGRRVGGMAAGYLAQGRHQIRLDLRTLPSGMYTVAVENAATPAQKLMLIR
jgi:hypothetical protein